MSSRRKAQAHSRAPEVYEVRIQGHLESEWADWFAGARILPQESGETVLRVPVIDQAQLYGLLRKVRDLGMPLLAVTRIGPQDSSTSPG